MSYPEIKSERYALIGGLNNKVSRYLTGQQELIRLVNYDFSVPGALTKRPDTAQFLGTSFGANIQSIFEMIHYDGVSYNVVFGQTNAYFSGSTTWRLFYGYSEALTGFTGYVIGGLTLNRISSSNFANFYWAAGIPYDNLGIKTDYGRFSPTLRMFGNATPQVPIAVNVPGFGGYFGATFASYGPPSFFLSGSAYRYSYAYYTDRGVVGPATPMIYRPYIANQGATTVMLEIPGFTVQAFKGYLNLSQTLLIFRETAIGVTAALQNKADVNTTLAIWSVPLGLGHTRIIDWGATTGMSYLVGATATVTSLDQRLEPNNYWPMSEGRYAGKMLDDDNGVKFSGSPRYIAMLNNMAIYSGFSYFPSSFAWSQLGFPELVANDDNGEIRTDNGDVISGEITYGNAVIIGKRTSLHEVTGTSPDTISVQQTTSQYGFINNQSVAIWENQLWFIDGSGKGVAQYNGAQTEIVSTKVEGVFKRINLTAAISTAWMLHVKQRNEVWAAIPIDGATTPNVIVVYDYVSQCWTTFEGISANVAAICKGTQTLPVPVFGFSNGDIRFMNATYTGAEFMTTAVRFPFVTNFGWSTTQVFRRLYVDVDPVVGMTHLFNSNYYLNDSNTVSLTRGITTISHQTRLDFGLPANGMSVELIEGSTLPTRVMGYTVESRFQRNV